MFKNISNNLKKLLAYSGFINSKFEIPEYHFKPNFLSTHSKAIDLIEQNSNVLDIGCNDGAFLNYLKKNKNCTIKGIEKKNHTKSNEDIIDHDLDTGLPDIDYNSYDFITMLDVIEHLNEPENFIYNLKKKINNNKKTKIILTTPNIGFFPIRISLLFGNFNYSSKGILDYTHKRLFTFFSFKDLLTKGGFNVENSFGIPAPFPLVLGEGLISFLLLNINSFLIRLNKKLFSFQMLFVVKK